jgi:uncharacterized protein YbjT (DUF2867 family)
MSLPIVAVVGITGCQGGAVARQLKAGGKFAIRGITRNPDSDKAKKVQEDTGCELVQADLNDKASLIKAFSGCHGAFLITNFWEIFDTEAEFEQGKNLGDAALAAGVKHCVFSSLEHTDKILEEGTTQLPLIRGHRVPHFDSKGLTMEYYIAINLPVTEYLTSFYFENFIKFGMGPKAPEGGGAKAITFPLAGLALNPQP